MFEARLRTQLGYEIVTVYTVDFNHDAFLIARGKKFKWVSMENFEAL